VRSVTRLLHQHGVRREGRNQHSSARVDLDGRHSVGVGRGRNGCGDVRPLHEATARRRRAASMLQSIPAGFSWLVWRCWRQDAGVNRAWTLEELAAWCVKQVYAERSDALQALGEAWGWLQSRDLITWNPDQIKEVLGMLVRGVYIPERSRPASHDAWPYTIPCVAKLVNEGLQFSSPITFLVGENGSGKSTIIEALAEAFKFDDRGGRNLGQYANNRPKSTLGSTIQLDLTSKGAAVLRGPRSKRRGFFLRAETAMGLLETKSGTHGYWEEDLAQASHGEGFLTVFATMFQEPLLYLMDEPEAALSFTSCLRLVGLMHQLGQTGAQVICATHSPILASTPGADIIEVGEHGSRRAEWKELELVDHWRRYMENPSFYLRHITE